MLHIHTLGQLLIKQDDTVMTGFVSQKVVALFVYLLHHPTEHKRDVLAEFFWSDTSGEQALKNLRTVISNLQKFLGDYVTITRQTIAITQMDHVWLDTHVFESNLDRVVDLMEHPYSPRKLIAMLETAIEAYQGDFLISLKTDNAVQLDTWVTLERERLRDRATDALFKLTELCLENGYYDKGIDYGRRLLAIDPYWEQAQVMMMKLLAFAGNRNAALQHYEAFARLLRDELDADTEESTLALYRQIKLGRLQVPEQAHTHNLNPSTSPYVEASTLTELVSVHLDNPECRLLTLLGQGGAGKTHLAQHIAWERLEDYRDGVFFVSLTALTEPEFLPQAILNAMNVQQLDLRRSALDILLEHLRDKHLLLVLDNFEDALSATDIVVQILNRASYVQMLVTSREQLRLQGEQILPVSGLPYPSEKAAHPDRYAAVQLFNVTAKRVNPSFDLMAHLQPIADICRMVNGLPLGIVIAAGWVQFMEPEEIAEQIAENLDFLTISRRDLPERHRGITALLDSTWGKLSDDERNIMTRLSVFPANFSREAAAHVARANLPQLSGLVSKSLLQVDGGRYQLHELLRRYAQSQAVSVIDAARLAHHEFYRQWLDDLLEQRVPRHELFTHLDEDYHNFWYFDWLPMKAQYAYVMQLARALPDYWLARGYHLREGVALLEQALPYAEDNALKANALIRLGQMLCRLHGYDKADGYLQDGLRIAEQLDNFVYQGLALIELNRVYGWHGDLEQAHQFLRRLVDRYQSVPDKQDLQVCEIISQAYNNLGVDFLQMGKLDDAEHYMLLGLQGNREEQDFAGVAISLNNLGIVELDRGNFQRAYDYFQEGIEIAREIQHTRHQAVLGGNMGEALHRLKHYQQAYEVYARALQTAHRINSQKTILNILEQLANVALDLNEVERAARLVGASMRVRQEAGLMIQPRQQAEIEARETRLLESLSSEQLEALLTDGESMAQENMVAYAINFTQHQTTENVNDQLATSPTDQ